MTQIPPLYLEIYLIHEFIFCQNFLQLLEASYSLTSRLGTCTSTLNDQIHDTDWRLLGASQNGRPISGLVWAPLTCSWNPSVRLRFHGSSNHFNQKST